MASPRKTTGRRRSKSVAPVQPGGRKKGAADPRRQGAPAYYTGDHKPSVGTSSTPNPLAGDDEQD